MTSTQGSRWWGTGDASQHERAIAPNTGNIAQVDAPHVVNHSRNDEARRYLNSCLSKNKQKHANTRMCDTRSYLGG